MPTLTRQGYLLVLSLFRQPGLPARTEDTPLQEMPPAFSANRVCARA